METPDNIRLTPEQKGVLASLAQETGESASSIMDRVLDELQERLHAARINGHENEQPVRTKTHKPIWARIREAFDQVPKEEMDELPRDGAPNVDHYAYGLPKRS